MESSKQHSVFSDIRSRELSGFKGRKRPLLEDFPLSFYETGKLAANPSGDNVPPIAISFCKSIKNAHILAMANEHGFLSLFDTRRKISSHSCQFENAEKARICSWEAHSNAVFDVCWIKEDTQILTASGDQTVKLWDVEKNNCTGVLMGHTGSVKSLSCHPNGTDVLVSGARDGSFAVWDLRCKPICRTNTGHPFICPTVAVKGAHNSPQTKKVGRGKAASVSITSVLYLNDGFSIATAGAAESTIKFWDTRNIKNAVTQICPDPETSDKKRSHGISSLSQDSNGVFLSASCTDNRIYLYNILQLDEGPVKCFSGGLIDSFYVKSVISPDAAHILGGSSDGNAYIWQVDNPKEKPVILTSHDEEVTAVDWCAAETGKLATCSDDLTVRIWNMRSSGCSNSKPPSSHRKRVMAIKCEESRQLSTNDVMDLAKLSGIWGSSAEPMPPNGSFDLISVPEVRTPEGQNKPLYSSVDGTSQRSPLIASNSPASVLNPPSSSRRKTIRDYFSTAAL